MTGLIAALLLAVAFLSMPRASIDHGSLVIGMPVASGWVVCGDKRKMSNLVDPTEDEVKVFALGPGVVAAATGLRRVIEGETLFDVVGLVSAGQQNGQAVEGASAPGRLFDDVVDVFGNRSDRIVRTPRQQSQHQPVERADRGAVRTRVPVGDRERVLPQSSTGRLKAFGRWRARHLLPDRCAAAEQLGLMRQEGDDRDQERNDARAEQVLERRSR
jgi:hypothetical protein